MSNYVHLGRDLFQVENHFKICHLNTNFFSFSNIFVQIRSLSYGSFYKQGFLVAM